METIKNVNEPFYYTTVITKYLMANVSNEAKLLYVHICSLTEGDRCSYADNDYYAEVMNLDKELIQEYLNELKEAGLIEIINSKEEGRIIKLILD